MLNEEEKKIVEYLRMSPKDSLKRDAADLIERLANQKESMFNASQYIETAYLWVQCRADYKSILAPLRKAHDALRTSFNSKDKK